MTYEEVMVHVAGANDSQQAETVKVRELKVREWPEAIRYLESDDDDGLTALACSKTKQWVTSLTPQSYRLLIERVKARNEDFFAVAEEKVNRRIGRIATLPKAALESIIDRTTSPTSSPNSHARPA